MPACPSFLPPGAGAPDAAQDATPSLQEGAADGGHAHKRQRVDGAQPAAQQQGAQGGGDGGKESGAEAGPVQHAAPCAMLVEDAIPWDAADPEGAADSRGESLPRSDAGKAWKASKAESRMLEEDTAGAAVAEAAVEQDRGKAATRADWGEGDNAAVPAAGGTETPGPHAATLEHANADADALAGRQVLEEPARVQPDSRGQEEYSPSHSLDVHDIDSLTSSAFAGAPDVSSLPGQRLGSAAEPDARRSGVRRATLRFVRAILDPLHQAKACPPIQPCWYTLQLLFSARRWCPCLVLNLRDCRCAVQVISRDVYKKVLERAVDKIVTLHADAPDASFLVEEAGKVQRLVSDYVQHLQGRGMDL